ncbi:hypothetical protein [Pseudomonas saponiphila]|uniref:hypothetical protein n=1 Tax=Pseudomonas saponiphila TaxID=556534 RepID=UPI00115F9D32|nr:hypothetical protein [Pseudomonas saponiphila]
MNISIFEVSIRKEINIREISVALTCFFGFSDLNALSVDASWELSEVMQENLSESGWNIMMWVLGV